MNKRFLTIMAIITVVFVGLLVFNKKEAPPQTNNTQTTNHTYGEGKSGVVLIEYGDFQCPACQDYYSVIKQIKEKYKDQITVQFRHFPIVSAHQNAMVAHRAAEAAAKQDKFWEMHDLLYQNQKSWDTSNSAMKFFEDYAMSLSLDMERFRQDAASEEVNSSIKADLEAGNSIGVGGTPSFVLDGKLIETPNSIESFEQLIDEAIKAKSTS